MPLVSDTLVCYKPNIKWINVLWEVEGTDSNFQPGHYHIIKILYHGLPIGLSYSSCLYFTCEQFSPSFSMSILLSSEATPLGLCSLPVSPHCGVQPLSRLWGTKGSQNSCLQPTPDFGWASFFSVYLGALTLALF